ncbi:hypothetical protein Hypma_003666 [Hypsizygus marmoreus]|uniref:F-box domain-containing protein n=1 Tax=Hypsizygus marmoreus TaxID=39966 RepID=A0A369J1D3_HYPMA|nr:hypothetical protein Hypma_003666 [Hypsizygus marmoreus]
MSPLAAHNASVAIIALPNELLSAIFGHIPPSTLTIIALLSHRFRAVAERLLYSSVLLTDSLSEASPVPWKTLRWCESMHQRTHLIEAAKKLQIRWQADPRTSFTSSLLTASNQLGSILPRLIFLESLEIFLGPANLGPARDPPIHAIERVIHGARLPLLQHCSLGAEWSKSMQPYTGVLASFLASLHSLRHLKLPDHQAGIDLPPGALPCLSSFRGSADTAAFLLPGRPVQALSLVGQDSDVNRENLLRMTHTTVPLRYLDLSAMSARPVLLRNISTHFPAVEKLRVKLALRHTLHYAFSGIVSTPYSPHDYFILLKPDLTSKQRLLTGLSPLLSAFDHLTFIDLSPTDVDGVGRADADEESAILVEWGKACPSLRHVIFPSETAWTLQDSGIWAIQDTVSLLSPSPSSSHLGH